MPVWLMLRSLVTSAIPVGGELLSNGPRRLVSRIDAFIVADPFVSIHTDFESPCASIVRLDIVELI